jgi:DNA-binding transcriptional LysR family regulator
MSRHALNAVTGSEGLVELPVEGFPIERHWYVVTPRGKRLSVVAETFLAFLRAHRQMLMPG